MQPKTYDARTVVKTFYDETNLVSISVCQLNKKNQFIINTLILLSIINSTFLKIYFWFLNVAQNVAKIKCSKEFFFGANHNQK